MAHLRLISLDRYALDTWNEEIEMYILVNGEYFWEDHDSNELERVSFTNYDPIEFTDRVVIELKDSTNIDSENDPLGTLEVIETQADHGEFDHFFRTCGMIYKLTYEVEK